MDYSRDKKCDDSQGGSSELYVFPFVKYSRSQVEVVDNVLIEFPYSDIYRVYCSNISFDEECKEDSDVYYEQKVSYELNKVLPSDKMKDLASIDFRIIIKDNNNRYRLLGLYTGLSGTFTKSTGTNRADFNGFSFSFSTKEENTAPFLNSLDLFEKNLKITVDTSLDNFDTFTIPTSESESYYYSVSTDDGYNAKGLIGDHTITFPTGGGVHEVVIRGVFPSFKFNNLGDKNKLTRVNGWGGMNYSSNQDLAFYGCSNLVYLSDDIEWINNVTSANDMFNSTGLTNLPDAVNLSNLLYGKGMFSTVLI